MTVYLSDEKLILFRRTDFFWNFDILLGVAIFFVVKKSG